MPGADRTAGYAPVAKLLHWLTALAVIGLICVGLWMVELPISLTKLYVYAWHKWIGLTVLVLTVLRLAWRVHRPPPALPGTLTAWERAVAPWSHGLLLVLLLALPLSGWLMSSAGGVSVVWFGVLPMPDLVPLGLCIKEWGSAPEFHSMQIVFGNIGNIRRPEEFRVTLHDEPKRNSSHVGGVRVPQPDGIGLEDTLRKEKDVRDQETVTVDPTNVIDELDESNNTVRFVIARKADGTADLPDCETVRGRASDWIGKMNPIAGTE